MRKGEVRQSNFELLRIIAMLMIVMLHYMGKGGALNNTKLGELNFIFAHFIEAFSIVAVNCYIMISGYFLVNSKFSIKKLITLCAQVLFYSIGIYLVLIVTGVEKVSIRTFIEVSFPVLLREYWFVSGYIALYILSPFLNTAIKAFNRRQLEKLILLVVVLLILWEPVMPSIEPLEVINGYSLTQLAFMYILAAYIRLYWDFKINKYIYLIGYFICAFGISFASIPLYAHQESGIWYRLLDYAFLGVIIEAFCLFMFIRELQIKSDFINKIGQLTLGVYLIHDHMLLRPIIYSRIIHTANYFNSKWFEIHALLSCVLIFLFCITIDYFRKLLFDAIMPFIEGHINLRLC